MSQPDPVASPYRPLPAPPQAPSRAAAGARMAIRVALIALAAEILAVPVVASTQRDLRIPAALVFLCATFVQMLAGLIAALFAFTANRQRPRVPSMSRIVVGGVLMMLATPFMWLVGFIAAWNGGGGAWGRPLRVRGRQLHPSLRDGSDWTDGARPDPSDLDEPTRRALEALWLHDAQKEHASVPAFARVSWLLAAAGAPAELLAWSHRAALEEIEHTRRCFALAAGYGRRTFTVEPMPELLLSGFDARKDPRITLAVESVTDGCQLEDFNADVAAACARACEAPVTHEVLERIAREERSHAAFSWAVLEWLLRDPTTPVRVAVERAIEDLSHYPRPTAVGSDKRALVERADPVKLRAHGRLTDAEWAALWDARLVATRERIAGLLAPARTERAA